MEEQNVTEIKGKKKKKKKNWIWIIVLLGQTFYIFSNLLY